MTLQILQTFSDIWEQDDIDICDDWADLIEYVIQKFVTIMGTNPHACASNLLVKQHFISSVNPLRRSFMFSVQLSTYI